MTTAKTATEQLIREPLYEKLRKRLLEMIELENIQMLPNEKELMARFGVSRNTLRRAIQELTQQNILQPVQGLGTIVYPVTEIVANSRILVACDRDMTAFQQEVFNKLLFMLNNSQLNTVVLMLDKENVDTNRFSTMLRQCDGVVIDQLCTYSPVIVEMINKTGKKMICLRWQPEVDLPFVAENVNEGFYQLTRHLLELGHKHIAFIGNSTDPRRMPGINRALNESGRSLDSDLVFHIGKGYRYEGYQATEALLTTKRHFTAILAHNDPTALGIEERLLIAGRRIPQDVSVTGFDNIYDSSEYPIPLTTCCGDPEQMIHEAIAYLYSSRNSGATLCKLVTPQLVIRQSTAPVAAATLLQQSGKEKS